MRSTLVGLRQKYHSMVEWARSWYEKKTQFTRLLGVQDSSSPFGFDLGHVHAAPDLVVDPLYSANVDIKFYSKTIAKTI